MMANPPSSHPPKSSTHRLLAAFHKEIGAYLSVRECHLLASTSRWGVACHTLASRRRSNHSSSTDTLAHLLIDESEKVTDLHAWLVRETSARFSSGLVLATGTRKTKRRRDPLLSAAKLRSVMRDLVLVASGMRASCLVDCCVLEPSLVALLLDALTSAKQSEWAVYGCFEHVYAVLLDGNVFFVNAPRFLKEKSIDLATGLRDVLGVNVGAHLRRPEVLFPHGEKTMRVVEMCETIETVCQRLIHLVGSPQDGRVLSLRKSAISATALAGILLCYPVIYDLYDPGNAELDNSDERGGPGWELQENCLSMCPLHVFQTSIMCVPTLFLFVYRCSPSLIPYPVCVHLEIVAKAASQAPTLLHRRYRQRRHFFESSPSPAVCCSSPRLLGIQFGQPWH